MKTVVQKSIHLTVVLMVMLFMNSAAAQDSGYISPDKNAVGSLIAGINSENYGLKRSCIYFAGLYRIYEASDALEEVLLSESEPGNQILAALALYRIDNDELLNKLKDFATAQENAEVKRMFLAVYQQHKNDSEYDMVGTQR